VIALLAHLTPTGFGPWADGMARLFLEPTELLLVIALVLLAVQSGRPCTDRLPLLLPLPWLLGGLIGLHLSAELLQAVACTALLGETVAIAVLTTLLGQLLAPPHPRWRAIAVRVGGSWITAASLLMFGWLVRHPQ
jgi:hypothetical protein